MHLVYKLFKSHKSAEAIKNNGCARGDSEVQLDEECAKVFAMDSGVSTVYDFPDTEVHRLPKFDEKDYQPLLKLICESSVTIIENRNITSLVPFYGEAS
ncbi:hypothetical protein GWI33_022124 [Rhynchophorus ferrugineus]|uniref:Uncharacterized protein n=1 Tax=Rhynchophorus ferrugineus TaxID=354439 RepID=A0A834HN76_RHYFE|nr:hypothetical protein GWI33_022124 [Rhynchophorus ferrugineus]